MRQNRIGKFSTAVFAFTLFSVSIMSAFPMEVYAYADTVSDVTVVIDQNTPVTVKGINVDYTNNVYVSLKDMAVALKGTEKEFNCAVSDSAIAIYTDYSPYREDTPDAEDTDISSDDEDSPDEDLLDSDHYFDMSDVTTADLRGWQDSDTSSVKNKDISLNKLTLNDQERRYYTLLLPTDGSDDYDCYIGMVDLCLLLDMDAEQNSVSETVIDTSQGFSPISPLALESYGYFQNVNTVVVGDATTGEIFYGYNGEKAYPIASTTKLMTYLLTMDAVSSGNISLNDTVTISKEAAALSGTGDGVVHLTAGQQVSLKELLEAALIMSSNECCMAAAEYVAGSEDAFVDLMDQKASELELNTAVFYNSNGLPIYTEDLIPAKLQNQLSGNDMFTLCAHILNTYPQVKEITSTKKTALEGLDIEEADNTNGVLYNMSEVNGLKTGTTNRSGACLITSLTVNDGAVDHDLLIVLLGAEGSQDRIRVSELMARYAKGVIEGTASKVMGSESGDDLEISSQISADAVVNMIVNNAMKLKQQTGQ